MDRRAFVRMLAAAATSPVLWRAANAQTTRNARNVVLVHGLFADGSCWSDVIARLQAAGLNATAVQNPLTTLPEAVASAQRVLARQDGPTVLVGHSFSGMIVTEAGVHANVSAVVYVAARAPDADEDYTALASTFPTPPATAGIVFDGDEGRLSARRRSYVISPGICRQRGRRYSMRSRSRSIRLCSLARPHRRRGDPSRVIMPFQRKTGQSIPISNASWPSAWAQNDRGKGKSPFSHIATRHDHGPDSGGGWTEIAGC
jgi:hypothetical protein